MNNTPELQAEKMTQVSYTFFVWRCRVEVLVGEPLLNDKQQVRGEQPFNSPMSGCICSKSGGTADSLEKLVRPEEKFSGRLEEIKRFVLKRMNLLLFWEIPKR